MATSPDRHRMPTFNILSHPATRATKGLSAHKTATRQCGGMTCRASLRARRRCRERVWCGLGSFVRCTRSVRLRLADGGMVLGVVVVVMCLLCRSSCPRSRRPSSASVSSCSGRESTTRWWQRRGVLVVVVDASPCSGGGGRGR